MKNDIKRRLLSLLLVLILLPFGVLADLGGLLPGMSALQAAAAGQPGYENPEHTFTSVEGASVSSKGNPGQTTVIVFGHVRCGNTSRTLRNISASSWIDNSDIRVIFAECNFADASTTRSFANTYASAKITACYDTTHQLLNVMWRYYDLFFTGSSGGTLPFTAIIDGNNRLRNVQTISKPKSTNALPEMVPRVQNQTTPSLVTPILVTTNPATINLMTASRMKQRLALPAIWSI